MHHSPVVEDDKISLLPSVCVYGRRRVRASLQVPAYAPNLCKVGDRGYFARGRIASVQCLHAAASDLQTWLSGLEVAPDHLEKQYQPSKHGAILLECQVDWGVNLLGRRVLSPSQRVGGPSPLSHGRRMLCSDRRL